MNKDLFLQKLISTVPSNKQIEWQKLEFTAFFHFGINTFTDMEWGFGTEDISIFNPAKLDANQWIQSVKKAGIKAVLLTCKHHDGFCLWPSEYTEHTIKNTPYKNGKGDIVKEVSDACKNNGIKFGIYLSPWDRNAKTYGTDAYNEFYINQLTELLTNYGEIYCVWWDGACGEGENGKKQIYDFKKYISVVNKLQPNACTSVCGIDVRWCGNEAGVCRESEWSVVSSTISDANKTQQNSQKEDNEAFREKVFDAIDSDLGSRDALKDATNLIWYPAEVDTSIRPGWFYHKNEDDKIKPLNKLLDIYYNSVGGNSVLLLNIPPNKDGLISPFDVKRLEEIGQHLKDAFKTDISKESTILATNFDKNHPPQNMLKDDDSYFKTENGTESVDITISFNKKYSIKNIVLQEQIKLSQRIENFEVFAFVNDEYFSVYKGTTIGYKKICNFNTLNTDKILIKITHSRYSPTLKCIKIHI